MAFEVSQFFFVTNSSLFFFKYSMLYASRDDCIVYYSTSYIKLFDQILTWFFLAFSVIVTHGSYNLFMADLMQDEKERSQTARRGESNLSF